MNAVVARLVIFKDFLHIPKSEIMGKMLDEAVNRIQHLKTKVLFLISIKHYPAFFSKSLLAQNS